MDKSISLIRKTVNHGMSWEGVYGYCQAVQVKDVIYLSGQLGHDQDGKLVAPAPLDEQGRPSEFSGMEAQMRQTYQNAADLLARFGASFDDVVEETLYVIDMEAALAVAGKVRKPFYGMEQPQCASTIVGVTQLALKPQLIEVSFRAVLRDAGEA